MREILFRGKRIDNGEWIFGSLFKADNGDCEICMGTPRVRLTWEVDPKTVGQYTGLCDNSGKKIFEGDIVRLSSRHVVKWEDGGFAMTNTAIQAIHLKLYTVIGNIHDNPELIGGLSDGGL